MEFYKPRKLSFKAWNREARLLVRLDSISCVKGQLSKDDHILLQYTGLQDKQSEELYEMDVVLLESVKYCIQWCAERCGWCYRPLEKGSGDMLSKETAQKMIRLCSYFESSANN